MQCPLIIAWLGTEILNVLCLLMQAVFVISWFGLPSEFSGIFTDPLRLVKNWHMFFCVAIGLWGGLIIGLVTEYYTSNRYQPVQVCNTLLSLFWLDNQLYNRY